MVYIFIIDKENNLNKLHETTTEATAAWFQKHINIHNYNTRIRGYFQWKLPEISNGITNYIREYIC